MYQKIKAEKARAEAERAKYENLKNGGKRGGSYADTPEVLRKPTDIKDDARYALSTAVLFSDSVTICVIFFRYGGQTTFMIDWVPLKCRDEKTIVSDFILQLYSFIIHPNTISFLLHVFIIG